VPHISLVFREMWDTTTFDRSPPEAESKLKKVGGQVCGIPHLAKNERDTRISCTRHQATATCAAFIEESRMKLINANKLHRKSGGMGHPLVRGGERSQGELSSPGKQPPPLPGGNGVPPLVGGSVQHVDTPGVHMLGHLENSVEFVIQGRLASRSRQRIVTRSQSNFVCTHNEYWYTSARAKRKCANLTITCPQRGQRASPLDRTPGYPGGERHSSPPADDDYLQQNRWQIGQGRGLPKWLWLPSL
jgi:hypothetical protein